MTDYSELKLLVGVPDALADSGLEEIWQEVQPRVYEAAFEKVIEAVRDGASFRSVSMTSREIKPEGIRNPEGGVILDGAALEVTFKTWPV